MFQFNLYFCTRMCLLFRKIWYFLFITDLVIKYLFYKYFLAVNSLINIGKQFIYILSCVYNICTQKHYIYMYIKMKHNTTLRAVKTRIHFFLLKCLYSISRYSCIIQPFALILSESNVLVSWQKAAIFFRQWQIENS